MPPEATPAIHELAESLGLGLSRVGRFKAGEGILLSDGGESVALPESLGFEHRR